MSGQPYLLNLDTGLTNLYAGIFGPPPPEYPHPGENWVLWRDLTGVASSTGDAFHPQFTVGGGASINYLSAGSGAMYNAAARLYSPGDYIEVFLNFRKGYSQQPIMVSYRYWSTSGYSTHSPIHFRGSTDPEFQTADDYVDDVFNPYPGVPRPFPLITVSDVNTADINGTTVGLGVPSAYYPIGTHAGSFWDGFFGADFLLSGVTEQPSGHGVPKYADYSPYYPKRPGGFFGPWWNYFHGFPLQAKEQYGLGDPNGWNVTFSSIGGYSHPAGEYKVRVTLDFLPSGVDYLEIDQIGMELRGTGADEIFYNGPAVISGPSSFVQGNTAVFSDVTPGLHYYGDPALFYGATIRVTHESRQWALYTAGGTFLHGSAISQFTGAYYDDYFLAFGLGADDYVLKLMNDMTEIGEFYFTVTPSSLDFNVDVYGTSGVVNATPTLAWFDDSTASAWFTYTGTDPIGSPSGSNLYSMHWLVTNLGDSTTTTTSAFASPYGSTNFVGSTYDLGVGDYSATLYYNSVPYTTKYFSITKQATPTFTGHYVPGGLSVGTCNTLNSGYDTLVYGRIYEYVDGAWIDISFNSLFTQIWSLVEFNNELYASAWNYDASGAARRPGVWKLTGHTWSQIFSDTKTSSDNGKLVLSHDKSKLFFAAERTDSHVGIWEYQSGEFVSVAVALSAPLGSKADISAFIALADGSGYVLGAYYQTFWFWNGTSDTIGFFDQIGTRNYAVLALMDYGGDIVAGIQYGNVQLAASTSPGAFSSHPHLPDIDAAAHAYETINNSDNTPPVDLYNPRYITSLFVLKGDLYATTVTEYPVTDNLGIYDTETYHEILKWNPTTKSFRTNPPVIQVNTPDVSGYTPGSYDYGFITSFSDGETAYISEGWRDVFSERIDPDTRFVSRLYTFDGTTLTDISPAQWIQPTWGTIDMPTRYKFGPGVQAICKGDGGGATVTSSTDFTWSQPSAAGSDGILTPALWSEDILAALSDVNAGSDPFEAMGRSHVQFVSGNAVRVIVRVQTGGAVVGHIRLTLDPSLSPTDLIAGVTDQFTISPDTNGEMIIDWLPGWSFGSSNKTITLQANKVSLGVDDSFTAYIESVLVAPVEVITGATAAGVAVFEAVGVGVT